MKHCTLIWMTLLLMPGCTADVVPYAEAIVVVDSDVPVSLAQQLRVDVYAHDGRWMSSRELLQDSEQDWPGSFSITIPRDGADEEALVRLRLYPTGRLRDYLGERFQDRPVFEPTVVPHSLDQACLTAQPLELGQARWVRRGGTPFVPTASSGNCAGEPSQLGSTVTRFDLAEPRAVRFAVLDSYPPPQNGVQVSLQLRTDCYDESTVLECAAGGSTPATIASEEPLAPGPYFLVTTGSDTLAPTDILVAAMDATGDGTVSLAGEYAPPPAPAEPLLIEEGITPLTEPQPAVTIDRLLRVRLQDGIRGYARVVLRGNCMGTMAKLGADPPHQPPVLDEAETCIDAEGIREPVPLASLEAQPIVAASQVGSFESGEPGCDDQPDTPLAVCVPGGVFLLGSIDGAIAGEQSSPLPERPALVSRFWIDRREVTVRRWREVVALGFVSPPAVLPNEDPFPMTTNPTGFDQRLCTFSKTRDDRDDFPINCITWDAARAFCQHRGGDLPTAVQWEYVATAANRPSETSFPWGEQVPRCVPEECMGQQGCHAAVYNRLGGIKGLCISHGFGPAPVSSYEHPTHGDATVPLNGRPDSVVYGLFGGVAEMTRDAFAPYNGTCWRAAALRDPACWELEAAAREARGAGWPSGLPLGYGAHRHVAPGSKLVSYEEGFRCAYPAPPEGP